MINIFKINYLLFVISLFSISQAGILDTLWTKTYGDTGSEVGYSIQKTKDGGFIIAGEIITTEKRGILLLKINSNGDTLWTKTYGNGPEHTGYCDEIIQQTDDNGFVVVGWYFSLDKNEEVYLIRTDSNGDTIWTKTYGGYYNEEGNEIQKTNDGGFIIVGYTETDGSGEKDVFIIRTDSIGDTLWTKTYGGAQNDIGYSVKQTHDGGFIIAGSTHSFGLFPENVYVIRIDQNGDTLWTKAFGGLGPQYGNSIQMTNDSGFIIIGCAGYDLEKDVYLSRINYKGDTLWTKTYGGDKQDFGNSIQQTKDGGFIIAGETFSFGSGGSDVYIIYTNTIGDTLWTKTLGGFAYESGKSVKQTNDGGFVIVGNTNSSGISENPDVYLIRLDSINIGIEEDKFNNIFYNNSYFVNYNIGNNLTYISFFIPLSCDVNLEVYDIQGKLVGKILDNKFLKKGYYNFKWRFKHENNQFFANGLYFFNLSSKVFKITRKISIIK